VLFAPEGDLKFSLKEPETAFQLPFSFVVVRAGAEAERRHLIRILLIEDDDEIASRLITGLTLSGFTVERADNGFDGHLMGEEDSYAAAILDLGLPQMAGLEVLKRWRASGQKVPVLILTARGTWAEKVDGLNAGADDYLEKPFHIPEIAARLKALIRRSSGIASPVLAHGRISFDTASNRVYLDDQPIELTAREIKILSYFMHRIGRVVSQAELNEHLYALEDSRESNTIEVYVSRLRRKLGGGVITTVRGLGYRMD
jgi:two-component system, OmpR family, response regulator